MKLQETPPAAFKWASMFLNFYIFDMATQEATSNSRRKDELKNEIAQLDYHLYYVNLSMERLRQELQEIDFFFANFGHFQSFEHDLLHLHKYLKLNLIHNYEPIQVFLDLILFQIYNDRLNEDLALFMY